MAKLIGIVAMTAQRVIGKDNDLPWHLPEDLQFFKRTTSGHVIVMGRKTFESIGRPLPKRRNVVLTRDTQWSHEGVDVVHTIEEMRALLADDEQAYIIGGSQIYAALLDELDELLVSQVSEEYEGDAYFPAFKEGFVEAEVVEEYAAFRVVRFLKR